jgi:hypothetical protein
LPDTRAWFAAGFLQMPTTSDSSKAGRWAARSVMSSPSHCVEDITAKSTAAVMKQHGGAMPVLKQLSRLERYGSKLIRFLQIKVSRRRRYRLMLAQIAADLRVDQLRSQIYHFDLVNRGSEKPVYTRFEFVGSVGHVM